MAFHPSLDRITVEARQIQFRRVLLTAIAFPPYAVGWVVAKALLVAWIAFAHVAAAFRVGWKDALKGDGGPGR